LGEEDSASAMTKQSLNFHVADALNKAFDARSEDSIVVEPIQTRRYARIGFQGDDIIVVLPNSDSQPGRPIRLSKFYVDYRVECRVVEGQSQKNEIVTIMRLKNPNDALRSVFCEVISLLLRTIPTFNVPRIADLIQGLIELFRAMDSPNTSTMLGLWGELFVIGSANDPDLVATAWHATPNDKFDLSLDDVRVEVETTNGPRRHHFSLEQVQDVPGIKIAIASLIVNESSTGKTVVEMISWVEQAITQATIRDRIRKIALKTIGNALGDDMLRRYDTESAGVNLRFFSGSRVPQPNPPAFGVTQIRFVADLQLVADIDRQIFENLGRLAKALLKD